MGKTLRLLLGDQLNPEHSWFKQKEDTTTYLMMEMCQETDYVTHHIQKVVAFFIAMRQFAQGLKEAGHQVIYITLDAPENTHDLQKNITNLIRKEGFETFAYQLPDEYRLDKQLKDFASASPIPVTVADTEHFLTSREAIGQFFKGKKQYLMESFYRDMRRKLNILMDEGKPAGGKWNYDHANRNRYSGEIAVPALPEFAHDASEIKDMLAKAGVKTMGQLGATSPWPANSNEAQQLLKAFIKKALPYFGTFQDAMHTRYAYLFHSRLSFALNTKMLHPLSIVKAVEKAWQANPERITLAQAEGFIRQIIGWREYMRGIYWDKMPDYAQQNFFGHERPLPQWFWTGKTKMNCLNHAITQSLDKAYAHHIQRLMVTGNFALLNLTDPAEVDAWYLGIYIDAIEWVEMPNTRGMSQFADGGIVGTKPYVSSANYIKKMSNYCSKCAYNPKLKTGEKACPFNSLYWNFYATHREKLEKNPRIGMMYRTWDKMDKDQQQALLAQASYYLENVETL